MGLRRCVFLRRLKMMDKVVFAMRSLNKSEGDIVVKER